MTKEFPCGSVAELLEELLTMKEQGRRVWSYDDPVARNIGFYSPDTEERYYVGLNKVLDETPIDDMRLLSTAEGRRYLAEQATVSEIRTLRRGAADQQDPYGGPLYEDT